MNYLARKWTFYPRKMGVSSWNLMIYSNKWIYAKTAFDYPVYPVGSLDSDNTKWVSMLQQCIMTLNQGHICKVKRFGRWTGQQHLLSDNGHVSTPYCNYIVSVQICNQSPNYKPLFSMLATFLPTKMMTMENNRQVSVNVGTTWLGHIYNIDRPMSVP